ncbi:hypothetical protein OH76DRAFT_1298618, partial [Lentinus brumalis]
FATRADLSMHGLTFGLLQTVLRIRVPPELLLRRLHCHGDSCSCRAISGDDLARAIVPRARELCILTTSRPVDAEHHAHGERVKRILADNYVPRHTTPGCTCGFLAAPMDDVRRLLEMGEVPVVVLEGRELVVRSASEGSYVAVSHVWADGLGSTTEEGLPRCQVERLAKLAGNLVPGGAFWQDGLCVPGDRPLRRRAIGLMAATYADAEKVLVIDAGIQSQCTLASSREEYLLRIATSGWMQRIWTLQEGILARELFFEVADGLIDCTCFDGASYYAAGSMIPLLQYCHKDDSALTYQPRSLASKPVRCDVNDLIALLRYRTTSHPEDETLAVAGLLGVDARMLVKVEGQQERMKALLMRVGRLPRQLAV